MNIGFFSETYSPDVNGVVTSINIFRDELERAGHKVYVFAPGNELFPLPGRTRRRERGVFRFNSFQYPAYKSLRVAIPFNWPIQRRIPKLKLDVVHSHTPFSMGLFATAVAKQQKLPHVHTYHTLYPEYAKFYFPGFKKWNAKGAEKLSAIFCNAATEIIAPSDGIKENLVRYGITRPITVLPTGIDWMFFEKPPRETDIRKQYGIPAKAPLIITVARLGKEKSVDFLLHQFKHLRKLVPDAWYLIVGDGPARLELETLARELDVIDQTVFTGLIRDRRKVIAAYRTADVFVFASKTDTQCLTLLEGGATGLPLVARFDKPLKTALTDGKNGYFVREDSPEKFAWKVHRLLGDRKLHARMGKESVAIAGTQSAERRAGELIKLYEHAVATVAADRATDRDLLTKLRLR